ncbi:MAG TPA: 5'/3'-nucleotidase SurE [Firmicutes bacterium]|nr:5'/3'-nucleotidase SurE [Bacillota bacterium]
MKLLLVNDDGIYAPGLAALKASVTGYGQIQVIAPHLERSGMSHAITVNRPLRLTEAEWGLIIDGTPADCVKMGIQGLKMEPDFVLAGINRGANLGTDVLYSGTVSAAIEAVLLGVPAVALSLCGSGEFMPTAEYYAKKLLFESPGILCNKGLIPKDGLLNINIPALPQEKIRGIRVTRLGVSRYEAVLEKRLDPRGGSYYWMGGRPLPSPKKEPDIDLVAVDQGYISITPLQFDLTYFAEIPELTKALQTDYSTEDGK